MCKLKVDYEDYYAAFCRGIPRGVAHTTGLCSWVEGGTIAIAIQGDRAELQRTALLLGPVIDKQGIHPKSISGCGALTLRCRFYPSLVFIN